MEQEEGAGSLSGRAGLPARVILTGFRATGKSFVGRLLAGRMEYRFIDTDDELVTALQCSVAHYVTEHGWPAFRVHEKELLARLALMEHVVVATGGGAVMHGTEWQALRRDSLAVWLRADAGTIRERLRNDGNSHALRPSLTGGSALDEVEKVLAEREPLYHAGSDLAIDTAGRTPGEIVDQITLYIKGLDK